MNPSTDTKPALAAPAAPRLREAFFYWLRLGCISFGGPAGQIAIMHQDLVERRRWISERRFLHALNYCMVLPGPEAQQLATYIGWLLHGTWGGIIAGALFVLPSLVLLIALSFLYLALREMPAVAAVLYGIKPAVVAIVLFAAHRIGTRALKNRALWAIALAALVAIAVLRLPFPVIILGAALIGLAGARRRPQWFALGPAHAVAEQPHAPALIDDHTPPPAHARFSQARLLRLLAVFALLWAGAEGVLLAAFGWSGTLTQMGWFFTKAALLTFGGAYAVLPYVYQGAVEHFGWLTPGQMIDGLALGETTPGPLIMVVAFVGFVGGYSQQLFGGEALLLAGIAGAAVATVFTFLPSFLFILAGGPLVESTHGEVRLTAPLTAITAAVVGVIVNLALFFAWHVFWPQGFEGGFDAVSALIGIGALLALVKLRLGIIPLIAICTMAGLLYGLAIGLPPAPGA